MRDALLILNAGSSSIKFALFGCASAAVTATESTTIRDEISSRPLFSGQIDGIGAAAGQQQLKVRDATGQIVTQRPLTDAPKDAAGQHRHALDCLLGWLDAHREGMQVIAVGHRVVHGGARYAHPLLLNASIRQELTEFIPLAPLHQPYNLDVIRVIADLLPDLPQVACFDTAFHTTQSPLACQFALPRAITALGVRRYGFHGISYEYIAETLKHHLPPALAQGRVIIAHLGNGASLCALHEGRSVTTSMGFTALDGLMMGTRTGNLDPGVLLYLMDYQGMDSASLTRMLYKESGLLGVSGISQDMRTLLDCAAERPEAREAIDLFCYRIQREIGSLAAALGGLDALVFTGGIGEHAAPVRAQICTGSRWLGVELDTAANHGANHSANGQEFTCISTPTADVKAFVIATNEEWMIARHTANCLRPHHKKAATD